MTIKAANSGGEVSTSFEIVIADAPPTKLTYTPVLATATVGILSGGEAPAVNPADVPITFSIEPVPPEGLEFDADTGAITGTPASDAAGKTTHTVTGTNTGGSISTALLIEINSKPPSGLMYGDNHLNMLLHISAEFTPKYDCKSGAFSIEPKLPPGLVLSSDGVISGVVTADRYFNTSSKHVVTLTNNGGLTTVDIEFFFSDPKRDFYELIDANEDSYIKDLASVVSIESVNNGGGCNNTDVLFTWLDGYIRQLDGYKSQTNIDSVDLAAGVKGIHFHAAEDTLTLCVYGHLDTKAPTEQDNQAFELREHMSASGPLLEGLGVVDSKGPLVAWLSTANAYCQLDRAFPVGLKFVVDTNGLGASAAALESEQVKAWLVNVDHICIAESSWLTNSTPCICYGLRGTMHFTVTIQGGKRKLRARSGTINEVMTDISAAMNAVSQTEFLNVLVTREDTNYDDIVFNMQDLRMQLGIEGKLLQSDKSEYLNAWWAHPAVSVHGIEVSAAQSAREMPSEASFTFSVRTVYGMSSTEVAERVTKRIDDVIAQSSNQSSITVDCQVDPFLADASGANYTAGRNAVEEIYGMQPDMIRSGKLMLETARN